MYGGNLNQITQTARQSDQNSMGIIIYTAYAGAVAVAKTWGVVVAGGDSVGNMSQLRVIP